MKFFVILGNPKIFSVMALAMSIYGTLCVLVLVLAYVWPLEKVSIEEGFALN